MSQKIVSVFQAYTPFVLVYITVLRMKLIDIKGSFSVSGFCSWIGCLVSVFTVDLRGGFSLQFPL